jgi:hypothetical protein
MATNTSNHAVLQAPQTVQCAAYLPPLQSYDLAPYLYQGWSSWQLLLTILLVFVTYDQGTMALLKLPLCSID